MPIRKGQINIKRDNGWLYYFTGAFRHGPFETIHELFCHARTHYLEVFDVVMEG